MRCPVGLHGVALGHHSLDRQVAAEIKGEEGDDDGDDQREQQRPGLV